MKSPLHTLVSFMRIHVSSLNSHVSSSDLIRGSSIPIFMGILLFTILLFPQQAHASFMDEINKCATIGLNGFLYLLVAIAQWILGITGSLALLMFVIGGFIWLISAGNKKWIEMGRTTLINALIGMLIVFGSWMFISLILSKIAPSVANWNTFSSSSICAPGRSATVGTASTGGLPSAPAASPLMERPQTVEERAIEKHSEDKPLSCVTSAQAHTLTTKCENLKLKFETVDEREGKKCESGEKIVNCINPEGLKCDARFPLGSKKQCGIACGKGGQRGERYMKDGAYFCCDCAAKSGADYVDKNCGVALPAWSETWNRSNFDLPENTRCCIGKVKKVNACKGKAESVTFNGTKEIEYDGKKETVSNCYCTRGDTGTVCRADTNEGCIEGYKCIKPNEIVDCEEAVNNEFWGNIWKAIGCKGSEIQATIGQAKNWFDASAQSGGRVLGIQTTELGMCVCDPSKAKCE